jgi:hypothetical protein
MQRDIYIHIHQIPAKSHQLFAGRVDDKPRLAFVIVSDLDTSPNKPDAANRGFARQFSFLAHKFLGFSPGR